MKISLNVREIVEGKSIYFDMDGTLYDFYGVEGYEKYLNEKETYPYEAAEPLVDFEELAYYLFMLRRLGYHIGIITWFARNADEDFKKRIKETKKEALRKIPFEFDEYHFLKYGTRKDYVAKDKSGIIFDDDIRVREKWKGTAINPNQINILDLLSTVITNEIQKNEKDEGHI